MTSTALTMNYDGNGTSTVTGPFAALRDFWLSTTASAVLIELQEQEYAVSSIGDEISGLFVVELIPTEGDTEPVYSAFAADAVESFYTLS